MKWKHISEHFLERDGVGRGGGAGGTEAPAKHGCFIQQQAESPGNKGPFCTSRLGNLFSSFRRSQMPATKCVQGGNSGERNREGWREQCAPGSWQTLLMSTGAFGWSTLVVLALSSWLCPCAPFPRQGDMAQLPLLQERLISSLPQERKRVDLHFPTEAGRNVPPYIILCTQVCPRPACGLEQLWKHLYPSHLNALFRQTFLVAFKRDRLIFFHVFL